MENPARNDVHATQPRLKKQRPKTKTYALFFATPKIQIVDIRGQQKPKGRLSDRPSFCDGEPVVC
jgi:hypothetical protein